VVGGRLCTELRDVTADVSALDSEGFWVVLLPYEWSPTAGGVAGGVAVCARFDRVRPARRWTGPAGARLEGSAPLGLEHQPGP
jgi:para-aminobenzoate synthetase component 1